MSREVHYNAPRVVDVRRLMRPRPPKEILERRCDQRGPKCCARFVIVVIALPLELRKRIAVVKLATLKAQSLT